MSNMISLLIAAMMLTILTAAEAAQAGSNHACSRTSQLMKTACGTERRNDYFVQLAKCQNEKEFGERRECEKVALADLKEERTLCRAQYRAREDVCDGLGQAPYDPLFEPQLFDNSLDMLTTPNPHFPMAVGNIWTYGGDEEIMVEVLADTKLIDDVTCFVIRDIVFEDGMLVEDTNDWFAIRIDDGAIWYCGEEAKDYEFFEGDMPQLPELVSIDGSFKVERDDDRAGIVFPGFPQVGDLYRAEFSLGNAEDMVEIIATDYGYGNDDELDELVPAALANLLCNNNCVVVAEYTPIEPDVFERKYYAPGIGFFLGTNPGEDEVVYLNGCNFNVACQSLPVPEDEDDGE